MIRESRRDEIAEQIVNSKAKTLITLGNEPLRQFTSKFGAHKKLSEYGQYIRLYGRLHPITIDGLELKLLPLVHPRQAARLGSYSIDWSEAHARWIEQQAPLVRGYLES